MRLLSNSQWRLIARWAVETRQESKAERIRRSEEVISIMDDLRYLDAVKDETR